MKKLYILTGINLGVSVATLGILLFGAKKMQGEVDEVKERTTKAVNKMREALNNIEF